MAEHRPATAEIKAFVPARDHALSLRFYEAIGFETLWRTPELACLRLGGASFLLQDFHVEQHTANFMMHLLVDDLEAWWQRLQDERIAERFVVEIGAPEMRPWGVRDFVLFDPSGVLWRVAERPPGTS
jgi:catechol 2,3-dioxygenase-like lactoylglutathione lyase family enzyme